MSDQCKYCSLRGYYEKCIDQECFHHENWINKVRIERIRVLESKLQSILALGEGKGSDTENAVKLMAATSMAARALRNNNHLNIKINNKQAAK